MPGSKYDQWRSSEVARLLALVESDRRYYQDIFAALPVPLLLADASFSLVMANREFRRRYGYLSTDLSRVQLHEVLKGAELETALAEVLSGNQQRIAVSCLMVTPDGELPVEVSIQLHRGWEETAGDELLMAVDTAKGISDQGLTGRLAARQLELPVANWILNITSAHFEWVSEAARILPVDGQAWGSLASRAGFVHAEYREVWFQFYREWERAPGDAAQIDYAVSDGRGTVAWRRDLIRVLPDGWISGVTLDITLDRRSAAQAGDEQKHRGLERLSGRLAHVANNLLMIVGGYAEEIMESLPEGDPRRNDLQEIIKASGRMNELTGELNRLVRPPRFQAQPVPLRAWMDEVLPRLVELLPQVEIQAGISEQPVTLQTHPTILTGLFVEAAKVLRPVLPAGSRIALNGSGIGGGRAAIWLKVEGAEVPDELKDRFLEPFAGPKEGSDPPLGMAGWMRPWQDLGGTLALETEPSDTFLLALTCAAEDQDAKPAPGPRLLVVEDEEGIRTLVTRALTREGYEVVSLATAEEALISLRGGPADLRMMITDFNMPGMSGMQLAELAMSAVPGLKVLLISGATEDPSADEKLRGGLPAGLYFLQKPFSPAVLVENVKRILS